MKRFNKLIALGMIFIFAISPLQAKGYYKTDGLVTRYENRTWTSYKNDVSPTGLLIQIGTSSTYDQDNYLGYIGEVNMNHTQGLYQLYGGVDENKNNIAFQEEKARLGNLTLFRTTKNVSKTVIPVYSKLKNITYTSKYYNQSPSVYNAPFKGYTLDNDDARKMVEDYANRGEISYYYYEALRTMPYEGEYDENGKRSGYGKLYNYDGELVYMGMWEDDVFSGYGLTFYNDVVSYVGNWENGFPSGIGIEGKNIKFKDNSFYATEAYRYYCKNSYGAISDYSIRQKEEKVKNMVMPFRDKETVFTLDTVDEKKLKDIVKNYYNEFKVWEKRKIDEIVKYQEIKNVRGY